MDDRYQNQSWYIRLWRRRYYILVPFVAFRMWYGLLWTRKVPLPQDDYSFDLCWKLAKGLAQGKMKWYYTMDEVKERWKKRREEILKKNG